MRHIHLKYFDFEISIVDKITLQITIESSRFQFQTESEIERKIWVKCFQSVRDRHVNTKKMGFNPASYLEKYIYDDLISEEEFFQVAETGDLLLLETENTGAKIQRMITSSKFGKGILYAPLQITWPWWCASPTTSSSSSTPTPTPESPSSTGSSSSSSTTSTRSESIPIHSLGSPSASSST